MLVSYRLASERYMRLYAWDLARKRWWEPRCRLKARMRAEGLSRPRHWFLSVP